MGGVERAIGAWAISEGLGFPATPQPNGKKIAIVGSGPSGMSCAYHLTRKGYQVTVFEAEAKPGGMLRYAIPDYRLSPETIEKEYKRVTDMGVALILECTVGKDISLDELKSKYDAIYVAIGASKGKEPDIKAIGHVYSGLDFLRKVNDGQKVFVGQSTLVIGGGNTAIDVARTARRLGAKVTIIYRRSRKEMPAFNEEIQDAIDEGVLIEFLVAPVKMACSDNGLSSITCTRMILGEEDDSGRCRPVPVEGSQYQITADSVIYAIGQEADLVCFTGLASGGWISVNDMGMTSIKGVFAGGDAVSGPQTVTDAVGTGKKAALEIDAHINGKHYSPNGKKEISFQNIPIYNCTSEQRNIADKPAVAKRLERMNAITAGYLSSDQINREAKRCFSCGSKKSIFTGQQYFGKVCIACHNCEAICPQSALDFPNYYRVEKGRWSTQALTVPGKGDGFPNPFMETHAPKFGDIEDRLSDMERVIYRRRSNRVFKKDQVPREMIHRILEAGRFAPSAGNGQPWKFVVVQNRELLNEISMACCKTLGLVTKIYQGKGPMRKLLKNSLAFIKPDGIDQRPMAAIQALVTPKFGDGYMDVFFGASTAIYVLVNHMGISKPLFSTGMCCQNIALAAHSLGLGTCFSGFASEPVNLSGKLKKMLGITWPYDQVATAIVVGFPAVQIDKPVEREFPPVEWIE